MTDEVDAISVFPASNFSRCCFLSVDKQSDTAYTENDETSSLPRYDAGDAPHVGHRYPSEAQFQGSHWASPALAPRLPLNHPRRR